MERRDALHLCAGLATSALIPLNTDSPRRDQWLPAFAKRWEVALTYSLRILDALPEADLYFQPIPEQKPFGLHFTHAAYWNAYYTGSITGTSPPAEPENPDKQTIKAYFEQTSQGFTTLIHSLKESALYTKPQKGKALWGKHANYWEQHTVMDFLLRAYMHTTHHRAQTIVYLRLKGVEPPFFQF